MVASTLLAKCPCDASLTYPRVYVVIRVGFSFEGRVIACNQKIVTLCNCFFAASHVNPYPHYRKKLTRLDNFFL